MRLHWNGMLCADTLPDIADRMGDILDGEHFTVVCCNSYDETSHRFTAVDVYPSQRLTRPIRSNDGDGYSALNWSTHRLSMGVHTRAATQAEGREDKPHGYVHFAFDPGRIEINHYAPAGYYLRWILAVERHENEEDA